MLSICVLVFTSVLSVSWGAAELDFPPSFQFGVATSAYQIEGAWNASGKSESIWDRYLHSHAERDNGDVACDSYHQWKRDVEMVDELGVDFYSVLSVSWGAAELDFPPSFQFGVATSAYQIEGAWNASGKSESIWDRYLHSHAERDNGDVACDSYHQWKRDVEMVDELGVDFYRFSIPWTRILPKAFSGAVNKEAAQHYSDLIDALLKKGIEPVVTLYHWDLPQKYQDLGGWTNPMIADWFADYARAVFTLYADRVKTWITLNEPAVFCYVPYQLGSMAPGVINHDVGSMLCSKHALLAHAKAWRVYDEEFRAKYHGRVSLTNFAIWFQPATDGDKDISDLAQQYLVGVFSHPIYSAEGGWPPTIEKRFQEYSKKIGYPRSVLPVLSKKEIELIKGTYDFFGLNHYSSRVIRRANASEVLEPFPADAPHLGARFSVDPAWEPTAFKLYPKHPEGLRKQLNWLKNEYGNQSFVIIENGASDVTGLDDRNRVLFFRDYLKQVLLAIREDGVNVTGYTAWSLMDGLEWGDGYNIKFGLYEVDFSSPARVRTPRASARYYSRVIANGSLDVAVDDYVTVHATTTPAATDYFYIYIGVGALVVVALVCLVVYQLRRRRNSVERKSSYVGVTTEES